ncbi:histidine kinase dimerization/phosphoacceptor domain -containing protein [Fundidesulfovibrio putealis]|uniref:histidine kinase dimerization/phosphoacceptor domain -containing protein n=1 Tax=Fundidesulfovibrio putealis TaxID=270496 RepID=UPI000409B737|nr:histidine kinase dimerization/phosphoacceptor domain -containing protein [Fundidesulfovibrio putealis]
MKSYGKLIILGVILTATWTAFVYHLYTVAASSLLENQYHQALVEARIAYEKDITYRRWSARLGGVYAEVSDALTPNPYLDVPERDVVTESGKVLTLINPAYMTRMVHTIMDEEAGLKAHITSLNPIRPENAPDEWETKALKSFYDGAPEAHEIGATDGKQTLRFMRPMITEKACLRCHAKQGYKEGEIRGGISVTVPMDKYFSSLNEPKMQILRRYLTFFAVGSLLILSTIIVMVRHERFRNKSETSIRLSEEKAWESEERFRLLINNAGDAIYLSDLQGRLLRVNYESERQTGYSREELLNMNVLDLNATHLPLEALSELVRKITQTRKASFETWNRHKDGHEFPVELRVVYVDMGSEAALLGISRDITERKRAEEVMARSLHEKEILLKEIHHRVKNNLQIISSLLSLQEQKLSDLGMLDVLAESRGRIMSMALIHDQLYHSGNFAEIGMEEYLRQLLPRLIQTYKGKRDIALRLDLHPIPISLDQAIPFGLIMNELTTNALKHGFRERITGVISIAATLSEGVINLSVEDNGIGLPPGFMLEKQNTLGLQIVTLLIGQLHGDLTMTSGPGTCFRLRFPMAA